MSLPSHKKIVTIITLFLTLIALAVVVGVAPKNTQPVAAANALDAIPAGQWYEIPNSNMRSVVYRGPLEGIFGWSGPTAIMRTWNGGAYDTKRNNFIIWGGGHQDYAGNEIYTFNTDTLTWSRVNDPSSLLGYANTSGIYADGTPASRHTYGGLAYIPDPYDKFFAVGGSLYSEGWGDNRTWLFDFVTKKWTRGPDALASNYNNQVNYDPVTGRVWLISVAGYLQSYNPTSNTWTRHGSTGLNLYG